MKLDRPGQAVPHLHKRSVVAVRRPGANALPTIRARLAHGDAEHLRRARDRIQAGAGSNRTSSRQHRPCRTVPDLRKRRNARQRIRRIESPVVAYADSHAPHGRHARHAAQRALREPRRTGRRLGCPPSAVRRQRNRQQCEHGDHAGPQGTKRSLTQEVPSAPCGHSRRAVPAAGWFTGKHRSPLGTAIPQAGLPIAEPMREYVGQQLLAVSRVSRRRAGETGGTPRRVGSAP